MNTTLQEKNDFSFFENRTIFFIPLFIISFILISINSNAADLYWVGGSGNWSDLSSWATTSGGSTSPATVPQSVDNVFFDANSGFTPGNNVVTIDETIAFCKDMDWTGADNMPVLAGPSDKRLDIFGSLTFISNMSFTFNGGVNFSAFSTGQTITSAGINFTQGVRFEGIGGEWILQDAFQSTSAVYLDKGTLRTNDQAVTISAFETLGPGVRTLDLGSSTFTVAYSFFASDQYYSYTSQNLTVIPGTSNIIITSSGGDFIGGGEDYYDVTFPTGGLQNSFFSGNVLNKLFAGNMLEINGEYRIFDNYIHEVEFLEGAEIHGNNTFDIMTLAAGKTYLLDAGSIQTITSGGVLNADGIGCSSFINLRSNDFGVIASIQKLGGTVDINFVVLADIEGFGATFTANNSVDLWSNPGWTINLVTSRNLYWVGGDGNWSDESHWSLSSGGVGGECVPNAFDNVFFDANSGFSAGDQVNIDIIEAYCKSMDWTGVLGNPSMIGNQQLFIFGSLAFSPNMNMDYFGEIRFMGSTTGKTILSAGHSFKNDVRFDGIGSEWILQDAFQSTSTVYLDKGTLRTNDQAVTISVFETLGPGVRTLDLGSSTFTVAYSFFASDQYYSYASQNLTVIPGTSNIIITSSQGGMVGGGEDYYDVTFPAGGVQNSFFNVNVLNKLFAGNMLEINGEYRIFDNYIHEVEFVEDATIYGNNTFDIITFTPGKTYILQAGSTQTITPLGDFNAFGNGSFPIELKSTELGIQAIIHKDGDPVCLDYLFLTDINATGTGFAYAGANSDDVFNNDGFIFEACPPCFTAAPTAAPVLNVGASTTMVPAGGTVTLVLQNVPLNNEVVWYNEDQTIELYANTANYFQTTVNQNTSFFAAFRDLSTGCLSALLKVDIDAYHLMTCPSDVTTTCEFMPNTLDSTALVMAFGNVNNFHSCLEYYSEISPIVNLDFCGTGTITRNWIAYDTCLNQSAGSCEQDINILAENKYNLFIPGDIEIECEENPLNIFNSYEEIGCDLIAVGVEIEALPVGSTGACESYKKIWSWVNWCDYDGFSNPIILPRRDLNNDGLVGDGTDGSQYTITGNDFDEMHTYHSDGTTMTLNGGSITIPSNGYYQYEQYVKIYDNSPPSITGAFIATVIEGCSSSVAPSPFSSISQFNFYGVTIGDNCTADHDLIITSIDVFSGSCPIILSRTYQITDECGNVAQITHTIEIDDTTPPTASGPSNIFIECSSPIPAPDTAVIMNMMDNCASVPFVAFLSDVSDGNSCSEIITRTYRVSDYCGNSTDITQTIEIDDTIPPSAIAPSNMYVQCIGDVPTPDKAVVMNVMDNCATSPLVEFMSDVSMGNSCSEVITRTYRITDDCGNVTNITQAIAINDTIAPTASNPSALNLQCVSEIPTPDISVIVDEADNCTTNPLVEFVNDVSDGNICPETIIRTYRITDDCGNSIIVSQTITINDDIAPIANCQSATVILNAAGEYFLQPNEISNNSTDNCGITNYSIDLSALGCLNIGLNEVELTISDLCGNEDSCISEVGVISSGLCPLPPISNDGGIAYSDPCFCLGNGKFGEEVVIGSANQGQAWKVQSTTLIDPLTDLPYPSGTLFVERPDPRNPGRTIYTLEGIHLDGIGYTLTAVSPFFPGQTLSINNLCHYADPGIAILNLDQNVCLFTDPFTVSGTEVRNAEGLGQFYIAGSPEITTSSSPNSLNWEATFNPLELGIGIHLVEFEFNAGNPAGAALPYDVGCVDKVSQFIDVLETPSTVTCNDLVRVSLDGDCNALINPDMILDGEYVCYDDYMVTLQYSDGGLINNPLTSYHLNQEIIATVTHRPSGNDCWGLVIVEDKWTSEFICAPDSTINCTVDPLTLPLPVVIDNCENLTPFIVRQEKTGNECDVQMLTITYQAVDSHGNLTNQCDRVITINPISEIIFPEDIEWSCDQYSSWSNIVDAAPLNAGIDAADACLETSSTRLRSTGSGEPNVTGLKNGVCKFAVTHSDQVLEACDGVSTDVVFKILRTWTVLNLCSGVIENKIQVVSVKDKIDPVIDLSNYDATFTFNETISSASHTECSFTGLIPVPDHFDNCSGIKSFTLQIWTDAIGFIVNGIPVTNNSGSLIGWNIPFSILNSDNNKLLYFTVVDKCGNESTESISFDLEDNTPPVPICRELTQVSLNSYDEGLSEVLADYFNEASYDDCGSVFFKVRKMELGTCDDANINKPEEIEYERGTRCNISDPQEWFDEDVVFCCEEVGTTVNVILRVYDRNPVCNGWSSVPSLQNAEGTHFDPPCYPVCDLGGVTTEGLSLDNRYYNDCMIEVLVEDKSRPDCVAPDDVWTDCSKVPENIDWDDSDQLDDLFGGGRAIDNCGADLTSTARVNLDLCGVGNVIRTFRARDAYGNVGANTCRQTIMIQTITDYCLTLPADFEDECTNNNAPSDLTYVETGCDLLAVSVEENELLAGSNGDECKKIVRTWSVINWCEYDGVSAATIMARADFVPPTSRRNWLETDREFCSDGATLTSVDPLVTINPDVFLVYPSSGYYTYDQHVKIFDNTAPVVSYDGDTKFCGGDLDVDPCDGLVDISIDVDEVCTSSLTTSSVITASTDPSIIGSTGGGSIFRRFPLGTHTVTFTVSDDCGNTSFLEVEFTVVDCKAPTPVCHNGLSIDVMPLSGMVEIWASDFDASSFDYCSDFIFRANVVEDQNGDGLITSDDYQRTLPDDDFVIVDCDNVGQPTMIQLWVSEQDGTADDSCADNQDDDFCVTFVEVQDNNGVCSGSKVAIDGKVATAEAETVEGVVVEVNDGATMTTTVNTDASGTYQFLLPLGGDYTVTPMRNDDVFNGVSTFDLLLISKHILNVSLLNSPYKVLAADANRSGSVSTLDLVAIRKIVLREANSFPNNTSWRFVSKSQIFPNANNPWTSTIQEVENFNDLTTNQLNLDFVGIKVGDVNGDAQANSILGVDGRSFNGNFELKAAEQNFVAGEEVAMTLSSDELNSINGYQFTIQFNTKALSLKDIEHGVTSKENFGLSQADNGYITVSWDGEADSEEAFTLVFEAKAESTLTEEVAISSALTVAEAYIGTDYRNVSLNFGQTASETTALYQNTPNPFKGETVIGFNMAEAATATMTISDVSGKVLKVVKGDYTKGYNTITVSSDELSTGVMYYQLDTDNFSQTLKMVVIK